MFTSMFALEMLLKLLACGPLGYIRNPYNIFDGIIVVIRWVPTSWEPTGAGEAPVSGDSPPHVAEPQPAGEALPAAFHGMGCLGAGSPPLPTSTVGYTQVGQLHLR